jgi:hypothetical protein
MIRLNRYMVCMTFEKAHQTSEVRVTIAAFNKRQAERKAANQTFSRTSRLLACTATLEIEGAN